MLFIVTYEISKYLIEKGTDENFTQMLDLLLTNIEEKAKKVEKSQIYFDMSILQNYMIFFMIITLNLKNNPKFICLFFNNEYFEKFIKALQHLPQQKKKIAFGILNNLFLEEYKGIYFRPEPQSELEDMFIKKQTEFSAIYFDMMSYYEKSTYEQMYLRLKEFDVSYDNFFNYYTEKINDDDKSAYKLCIAQSMIRVAFSKEKTKYLQIGASSYDDFFEFNFLSKVVSKDMIDTKRKFGDEYKTLFRKEDLCDDIIKYMFFIFGNTMMIESMVKPLSHIINWNNQEELTQNITKEKFEYFISEMVSKVKVTIPFVLKILMKLVYVKAKEQFTIEDDNYSPLYTVLIFNFLISPRIQNIYKITSNSNFFRSLNRLIRNTCYNFKFDVNDQLSSFNEAIETNNKQLKDFVEKSIMVIDLDDDNVKRSLSDLFTEKYLIYPKFVFYWDSQLICSSISGGADNIITYSEITKEQIHSTKENKKKKK